MFPAKRRPINHYPSLDPRKRNGGHSSARSRYQDHGGTTYDAESGQVYIERTASAATKPRFNWINEYKTPSLVKRRRTNREGAASLFDMSKAKVARETQYLTAIHLQELPPSIGRKLWDEVTDNRLESFHAWRTFASAFPESFKSPYRRFFLDIKEPVVPLSDYFAGFNSASTNWLACLRIAPHNVDRSDLVRIAQLGNLAVLDVSDDVSLEDTRKQVDERLFKTWSEMAHRGEAFKYLRVLLIRGQEDVSTWIFKYLDSFPSLCFMVLSDCRLVHQQNRAEWTGEAASHGWEARHAKRSSKSLRPLIDDKNFYLGSVSGCYYHSKEPFDELAEPRKAQTPDRLPVAEVWIGKPEPWLHLIEDFPGRRTVWFDNKKTRDATGKAVVRSKTETPTLAPAPAACDALLPRVRTAVPEDCTKRTRDVLSSPSADTKSPPHKRATMMLRSKGKTLNHIMADFG